MAGAVGIDTRSDRPADLRPRLRHRRRRRRGLHHDRLDRPDRGSLYIVDTFLVVVFGGAQSLLGTVASAFTHRADAIDAGVLPDRLDGQGADAARS